MMMRGPRKFRPVRRPPGESTAEDAHGTMECAGVHARRQFRTAIWSSAGDADLDPTVDPSDSATYRSAGAG